MKKFFYDISRDRNSSKISATKTIGLIGVLLLFILFGIAMYIMWVTATIDHVLVGEMMAFVLTLLGYKNGFGFKKNSSTNNSKQKIDALNNIPNDDENDDVNF